LLIITNFLFHLIDSLFHPTSFLTHVPHPTHELGHVALDLADGNLVEVFRITQLCIHAGVDVGDELEETLLNSCHFHYALLQGPQAPTGRRRGWGGRAWACHVVGGGGLHRRCWRGETVRGRWRVPTAAVLAQCLQRWPLVVVLGAAMLAPHP